MKPFFLMENKHVWISTRPYYYAGASTGNG
jgi:hypothetical protein